MKSQDKSKLTILALAFLILFGGVASVCGDDSGESAQKRQVASKVSIQQAKPPMKVEISSALKTGKKLIADIQQSLRASTDLAQSKSLHMDLERAKSEVEISILQIQFKYAQTEGRTDDANLLDKAIESLKKQNERAIAETSKQ